MFKSQFNHALGISSLVSYWASFLLRYNKITRIKQDNICNVLSNNSLAHRKYLKNSSNMYFKIMLIIIFNARSEKTKAHKV